MKIKGLSARRRERGRVLFSVAAALAVGFAASTASHAGGDGDPRRYDPVKPAVGKSYEAQIKSVIERAQTDATFAAHVREAGPEAYPLAVLIAAGYDRGSHEYRRYLQQRMKGGRGE